MNLQTVLSHPLALTIGVGILVIALVLQLLTNWPVIILSLGIGFVLGLVEHFGLKSVDDTRPFLTQMYQSVLAWPYTLYHYVTGKVS